MGGYMGPVGTIGTDFTFLSGDDKLILIQKWIISCILYVFRFVTGSVTDKFFESLNYFFASESDTLPPIKNTLLLDSATSLARKIRTGEVSAVEVMKAYIERIEEMQPIINAMVDERFAAALEEAAQADAFRLSGQKSEEEMEMDYPLFGVPFSVKEAISVTGMSFTAGVVKRRGMRGREDAEVVERLRKAGAIPIVVTNTSEQCFWMEAYNKLHGRTNNPYDPKRTAGGSSGGEGALIASAGSVIGVGNDIGGSIRIPAFFNGVFGHKPSRGMVPNRGHFPPTEPVLHQYIGTGPMCRFATDLKLMLEIMAGSNSSCLQLDRGVDIKTLKVYYMEDDGGNFTLPVAPAVKQALHKVVDHFRNVCNVPPQQVKIAGLKHGFKIWAYAVSAVVANVARVESRVFGRHIGIKSMFREIVSWVFGFSQHTLPIIATVIIERFLGPKTRCDAYPFIKIQKKMQRDFEHILQEDSVFIMPTLPETAAFHYANSVRAQNCGYVAAFNVLGLPATSCPVGLDEHGLPIGVQVVAALRNDRVNLAVAREIERTFGGWVCPSPII